MSFRVVLDTNVVVAGNRATSAASPNREILQRWIADQFTLLYSDDTRLEYIEKLIELGISQADATTFIRTLVLLAEHVPIDNFHFRAYPSDPDDVPFLLCAVNGDSSHLVTYDSDFEPVRNRFDFRLCTPVEFLHELRESLGE